jgi:uncharacterized membrane protein
MALRHHNKHAVFTGLVTAVAISELKGAAARGEARMQLNYAQRGRPARMALVGFVTLPLLWTLYSVVFTAAFWIGDKVSPFAGLACLLLCLAAALSETVKQLRNAWTGVVR